MTADTTRERLKTVFRTALGLGGGTDVETLEYNKVQQWDSVAHMSLVAAIEDAFGVMLDTDDVLGMSSFDKALDILKKHDVAD